MQRLWQHWSCKTQDEDIQNKKHNTENKKTKDEQHGPHQNVRARKGLSVPATYKTPTLLLINSCWTPL